MGLVVKKGVLAEVTVKEAMRRQVVSVPSTSPISLAIRCLIKYKVNALLVTDESSAAKGVVSKTDIMGAYYASLPLDSPVEHIMVGPPLFCNQDDSLESSLALMRSQRVYRLYVCGADPDRVLGVLAYPDIVGLLYRLCRNCEQSIVSRRKKRDPEGAIPRYRVKDVMTPSVTHFREEHSLSEIMEGLSEYRFGAVLIKDSLERPKGVVSKTDLVLAYKRGIPSDVPARSILSSSTVLSCDEHDWVEDAIRSMVFSEVHRIFVHSGNANNIVGVFSLSDVVRLRSGSCHACVSSRIRLDSTA